VKLKDLVENDILVYGDRVMFDDPGSQYAGMIGKVVDSNGSSVSVKFPDVKKAVLMAATALKKVDKI